MTEKKKKSGLEKATELIMKHEGFSEMPYKDRVQWSSGFGTKAKGPDERITREEAKRRLELAASRHYENVDSYKFLNDEQKAALTSFIYNVGFDAFQKSAVKAELTRKNPQEAARLMKNWVFQNGQKLKGLVKRRREESALLAQMDLQYDLEDDD